MATSNPDEELVSSIASLSPPLFLKTGTLDLPNVSDSLPLDINPTHVPILNGIPSTTQPTTQPLSSTLKTRHSPTPPPKSPPFVCDNTSHRITGELSQTPSKYPKNLIYNSTAPLSFETYPEDIYTIPLIREHHDSYLYYIDTHSLVETPDEPPFSIPFTSPINHSDTFRKNIHPHNVYIPIANVFTTFLNNLQEKNNLLHKHVFNPSSIQTLLQKESLFDLPNIEQFCIIKK